jgi:hypothetical protein
LKYVVMQKGNREYPFIFPDEVVHAHMAGIIKAMWVTEALQALPRMFDSHLKRVRQEMLDAIITVSAGDYDIIRGKCSGSSQTLGLSSRGDEDEKLLWSHDYGGGIVD